MANHCANANASSVMQELHAFEKNNQYRPTILASAVVLHPSRLREGARTVESYRRHKSTSTSTSTNTNTTTTTTTTTMKMKMTATKAPLLDSELAVVMDTLRAPPPVPGSHAVLVDQHQQNRSFAARVFADMAASLLVECNLEDLLSGSLIRHVSLLFSDMMKEQEQQALAFRTLYHLTCAVKVKAKKSGLTSKASAVSVLYVVQQRLFEIYCHLQHLLLVSRGLNEAWTASLTTLLHFLEFDDTNALASQMDVG